MNDNLLRDIATTTAKAIYERLISATNMDRQKALAAATAAGDKAAQSLEQDLGD